MSLSLNALKNATGATAASLSSCAGTTTGPIKMSEFKINSISTLSGTNPLAGGASATYTLNFTGAGSRFISRIGGRYQNFTWTENHSAFSFSSNQDYTAAGTADSPSVDTEGDIYGKLTDTFNVSATNYNTNVGINLVVSGEGGS